MIHRTARWYATIIAFVIFAALMTLRFCRAEASYETIEGVKYQRDAARTERDYLRAKLDEGIIPYGQRGPFFAAVTRILNTK